MLLGHIECYSFHCVLAVRLLHERGMMRGCSDAELGRLLYRGVTASMAMGAAVSHTPSSLTSTSRSAFLSVTAGVGGCDYGHGYPELPVRAAMIKRLHRYAYMLEYLPACLFGYQLVCLISSIS
jgi:hypothetical protein